MANTKQQERDAARNEGHEVARREGGDRGLRRWEPAGAFASPFEFVNRMSEEMDRTFDRMWREFGLPRRSWMPRLFESRGESGLWAPRVEAFHKGDRFVVRAELPGLKKDDVQVELTDDAITIRGERREEREEKGEGYYHSEREYGQFHRAIPLPEGVIGDSARASFRDGILEVTMQAAPESTRAGRRLEITDGVEGERKK